MLRHVGEPSRHSEGTEAFVRVVPETCARAVHQLQSDLLLVCVCVLGGGEGDLVVGLLMIFNKGNDLFFTHTLSHPPTRTPLPTLAHIVVRTTSVKTGWPSTRRSVPLCLSSAPPSLTPALRRKGSTTGTSRLLER